MTPIAATPELPAILPDSLYAAMHRYRTANWGDGPEYAGLYEAIRAYALAAIAAATKQPPVELATQHVQLGMFYDANTTDELIDKMEAHILRLQTKLADKTPPISFVPRPVREG